MARVGVTREAEAPAGEVEAAETPALQNVQVCCRIRPLVPSERRQNARSCVQWTQQDVRLGDRAWPFDTVFPGSSPQEAVFHTCVKPLVHACFEGYNATVLAYGQTGSGKTYTMGTMDATGEEAERGIIPRVLSFMFQKIATEAPAGSIQLRVGYLEIYNEEVRDLLHPEISPKSIALRETRQGRIVVQGAREEPVAGLEDVIRLFALGNMNRTTGSTLMNDQSSRSHAIFTVLVSNAARRLHSKFHLVDLAGSERAKRTGAEGLRLKESVRINQGLLALGKVISALSSEDRHQQRGGAGGPHAHVPYRESKLTRLLQDSLGGNSSTVMIACVSPADSNLQETVNTLKYASKARKIQNTPVVNEEEEEEEGGDTADGLTDPTNRPGSQKSSGQAQEELIASLQAEIALLNSKLGGGNLDQDRTRDFDSAAELVLGAREQVLRVRDFLQRLGADSTLARKTRKELQQLSDQTSSAVDLLTAPRDEIRDRRPLPEGWNLLEAAGRFQEELHAAQQELKQLEIKLRDCMDDLSRDEEIFADKLREIKELQASRDAAVEANHALRGQLDAAKAESLSARDAEPPKSHQSSHSKSEEVVRLEAEYRTLQQEAGSLSSENARLGQDHDMLAVHQRQIEDLGRQRQKKMSLLSTLEASRAEAESLLRQYASRIDTLEDQARSLRGQLQHEGSNAAFPEAIRATEQQLHACMVELRTLKQQNTEQQRIQELQMRTQQRIVRIREELHELVALDKQESVALHRLRAELSSRKDQLDTRLAEVGARTREIETELRRLRKDSGAEWGNWTKVRLEGALAGVKRRQQVVKDLRRREEIESQRRKLVERQRETRLSLDRSQRVSSSLVRVSQTIQQLDDELQKGGNEGRDEERVMRRLEEQRAAAMREKQRLEEEAREELSSEEIRDRLRELDDTLEALETEIEYSNRRVQEQNARGEEAGATTSLRAAGMGLEDVARQVASDLAKSLEREGRPALEQVLTASVAECLVAQHALEGEKLRAEEAEQARMEALRELAQGREALRRMREESAKIQDAAHQAEARARYLHEFLTKTQLETPPHGVKKVRVSSKALREIQIAAPPPPAPNRIDLTYSARFLEPTHSAASHPRSPGSQTEAHATHRH